MNTLTVNGKEVPFPCACGGIMLTYDHALRLANKPPGDYTVTYFDKIGRREGFLHRGERVPIRPGTVLNVMYTGNA